MKHFKNIEKLIEEVKLPGDIIEFLKNLKTDIELGIHKLNNGNYANVMELDSKLDNGQERNFEVHKRFIDIQIVLMGEEIMSTCKYDCTKITKPYEEETDYEFFSSKPISNVILKPFEPLLINKEEPHSGGFANNVNHIKKVIIKVK